MKKTQEIKEFIIRNGGVFDGTLGELLVWGLYNIPMCVEYRLKICNILQAPSIQQKCHSCEDYDENMDRCHLTDCPTFETPDCNKLFQK